MRTRRIDGSRIRQRRLGHISSSWAATTALSTPTSSCSSTSVFLPSLPTLLTLSTLGLHVLPLREIFYTCSNVSFAQSPSNTNPAKHAASLPAHADTTPQRSLTAVSGCSAGTTGGRRTTTCTCSTLRVRRISVRSLGSRSTSISVLRKGEVRHD